MKEIFLGFLLSFTLIGYGQQDLSMYNLNEIPQSNYANPSNQFNGKFYVGIPVLSSMYFSASNSGFAYSDVIRKNGDSLLLDFNKMIKEIKDENYLSIYSKIDLLSFGLSINESTQIMFNISENAYFRLSYPKDLIRFIYKGNASFEDHTANLKSLGINASHFREYAAGISHQLTDKLRIGGKVKYLYGMENIYTKKSDISIYTDPQTFEIVANSDLTIHTAGIDDVNNNESVKDYLMGRKNRGLAFDLGGAYTINDKFSVSGSVIDLGFIKWNSFTTSYSNNGEFSYSGVEVDAFGDNSGNNNGNSSFDRVADSLEKAMSIDTSHSSYTAPLTTRFYAGVNYNINEVSKASGVIQSEVFQGRFYPSLTLMYYRKMTKWITLGASYSMINRSYNNLGLSINLNPGPVQFYVVSDNLLGVFQPQHSRHLQVRFGINFIVGSNKSNNINAAYQGD